MRDATRRRICRIAFFAVCLAPTLGIGAWASFRNSARYAEQQTALWQRQISQFTGLRTVVQRVWSPAPQRYVLEGVQLWEPTGQKPLVQAATIEIYSQNDVWVWEVSYPEIGDAGVGPLVRRFSRRLLQDAPLESNALLLAPELTVRAAEGDTALANVALQYEASRESGAQCELRFGIAGETESRPVRIVAQRRRINGAWATLGEFKTGDAALPWSSLRSFDPRLLPLGDSATFRGVVDWASWDRSGERTWRVTGGELREFDLDRLVSDHFPHKLSGGARLIDIECQVINGRVDYFSGQLHSTSPGVASRRLLESLEQFAGINADPLGPNDPAARRLLAYSKLAVGCELQSDGFVELTPLCTGPLQGAILLDAQGQPLLLGPSARRISVASLVTALAPRNDLAVSATSETAALLSRLPLPGSAHSGEGIRLREP